MLQLQHKTHNNLLQLVLLLFTCVWIRYCRSNDT